MQEKLLLWLPYILAYKSNWIFRAIYFVFTCVLLFTKNWPAYKSNWKNYLQNLSKISRLIREYIRYIKLTWVLAYNWNFYLLISSSYFSLDFSLETAIKLDFQFRVQLWIFLDLEHFDTSRMKPQTEPRTELRTEPRMGAAKTPLRSTFIWVRNEVKQLLLRSH